jgi:hypothetical protein
MLEQLSEEKQSLNKLAGFLQAEEEKKQAREGEQYGRINSTESMAHTILDSISEDNCDIDSSSSSGNCDQPINQSIRCRDGTYKRSGGLTTSGTHDDTHDDREGKRGNNEETDADQSRDDDLIRVDKSGREDDRRGNVNDGESYSRDDDGRGSDKKGCGDNDQGDDARGRGLVGTGRKTERKTEKAATLETNNYSNATSIKSRSNRHHAVRNTSSLTASNLKSLFPSRTVMQTVDGILFLAPPSENPIQRREFCANDFRQNTVSRDRNTNKSSHRSREESVREESLAATPENQENQDDNNEKKSQNQDDNSQKLKAATPTLAGPLTNKPFAYFYYSSPPPPRGGRGVCCGG